VDLSEEDLVELVAAGEGRGMEFKRGLPRDEKLARTLCAFANTRGGMLLVGVTDKGGFHGVHHPKKVMEDIRRIAHEFLVPPLRLESTTVRYNGVAIVAAAVAVSPLRPHEVIHDDEEGEVVVRVGSSNRIARGATLEALHAGRNGKRASGPLESLVLAWVEQRTKRSSVPGGDATPARFAKAHNIGLNRARRAFVRLERDGQLVGHGRGTKRAYCRP